MGFYQPKQEAIMKKTIIAVRGQPDAGKTSSIKLAYNELLREGSAMDFNPRWDANELKAIVAIDGALVCFASAGDQPERLERTLRFLLAKGCIVIVCAARVGRTGEPYHRTIDVVDHFAREQGFDVDWISKLREPQDQ